MENNHVRRDLITMFSLFAIIAISFSIIKFYDTKNNVIGEAGKVLLERTLKN